MSTITWGSAVWAWWWLLGTRKKAEGRTQRKKERGSFKVSYTHIFFIFLEPLLDCYSSSTSLGSSLHPWSPTMYIDGLVCTTRLLAFTRVGRGQWSEPWASHINQGEKKAIFTPVCTYGKERNRSTYPHTFFRFVHGSWVIVSICKQDASVLVLTLAKMWISRSVCLAEITIFLKIMRECFEEPN